MAEYQIDQSKIIILDNGSYQIKYGFAQPQFDSQNKETKVGIYENLKATERKTGQQLIGERLKFHLSESSLIYQKPQTRGIIVNFDTQMCIWEDILQSLIITQQTQTSHSEQSKKNVSDYSSYALMLTVQLFSPQKVIQRIFEIAFEYFKFGAFFPINPQRALYEGLNFNNTSNINVNNNNDNKRCQLLVECGHSATYVVPFFDQQPLNYAIRKLDVGGRLLSSQLKEVISFRHMNLKQEHRLINQIKEAMCFISTDFENDIKQHISARTGGVKGNNKLVKFFVLPQIEINKKGYATDEFDKSSSFAQAIALENERIIVPELLFNPKDVGMPQGGIVSTIQQSISAISPELQNDFYENIVLCGGSSQFVNFRDRLYNELRPNTPDMIDLNIYHQSDILNPYYGCQKLAQQEYFNLNSISKADYIELGPDRLKQLYLI